MSTTTCTVSLIVMGLALVSPGTLRAEDETKTDKHVVQTEVHFAFDSAELTASARSQLDQAARWIREQKAGSILIEGHADLAGSEPYNKDLSERRAFAARDYLMAKGVPAEMVRILPYGEGLPAIDSNGPWTHYQITNSDVNTSSIQEDDDVMQLPAGAGFSLRLTRSMIFDVRGTVRAAVDDGMFDQVGNTEDDGLESWSTTAHLGFGF